MYIFKPIHDDIDRQNSFLEQINNINERELIGEDREFVGNWMYGQVFPYKARYLMEVVLQVLGENQCIILKTQKDYRIKVVLKNLMPSSHLKSEENLLITNSLMDEEFGNPGQGGNRNVSSSFQLAQSDGEDLESSSKKDTNKKFKYSKSQINFRVQIYQVDQNNHFIDIALRDGHPLVFIEFCNRFLA